MRMGLTIAAVVAAIASPAVAGTTVFVDPDFQAAHFSTIIYTGAAGYVTSVTSATGVGGVGTALNTHYDKTGSTSPAPRFQVMYDTAVDPFVYDPSAQGAITSIDASLDQRLTLSHNGTPVNLGNAALQLRVLARQDGDLYEAFFTTPSFAVANAFVASSKAGIVQSDFKLFDPANPYAARTLEGLDFTGGAITFGFELTHFGVLVNNGPSTGFVSSDLRVDNFRLTLNTVDAPAVPEPATWALMIGGFGLAGAMLRRRRLVAA